MSSTTLPLAGKENYSKFTNNTEKEQPHISGRDRVSRQETHLEEGSQLPRADSTSEGVMVPSGQ